MKVTEVTRNWDFEITFHRIRASHAASMQSTAAFCKECWGLFRKTYVYGLCHTFYAPSISVVSSPSGHFLECLPLPCLLSTYTVRYKKHIHIYIHIVHAIWTYNLIVDISCLLLLLAIRLFLWSSNFFVRLLYSLLSRISDFSPSSLNHVCLTALSSKQTQLSQSRALRLQLVMIFRYHSHLYVLIGIYT